VPGVQAPSGAPDWLAVFTAEERPDLWATARDESLFDDVWPVYNMHGNHTGQYFGALFPQYAHLQVLFTDQGSGGDHRPGPDHPVPLGWHAGEPARRH
jgi:hypothetical protein